MKIYKFKNDLLLIILNLFFIYLCYKQYLNQEYVAFADTVKNINPENLNDYLKKFTDVSSDKQKIVKAYLLLDGNIEIVDSTDHDWKVFGIKCFCAGMFFGMFYNEVLDYAFANYFCS